LVFGEGGKPEDPEKNPYAMGENVSFETNSV